VFFELAVDRCPGSSGDPKLKDPKGFSGLPGKRFEVFFRHTWIVFESKTLRV
jgi:hypothetical protein